MTKVPRRKLIKGIVPYRMKTMTFVTFSLKTILVTIIVLATFNNKILAAKSKKQHNLIFCSILDEEGNTIRFIYGLRCVYFNDGSYIAGNFDFLRMVDGQGKVLWEKNIHTHHHLALNQKKDRALVMTSSLRKYKGKEVRFDRLSLFNLKGEEIAYFDFYEKRKALEKIIKPTSLAKTTEGFRKVWKIKNEYSHANSFYEIPKNDAENFNEAFKEGNFIVNSNNPYPLVFILDKNLEKIIWHIPLEHVGRKFRYHDIQVLKNGNLLLLHNNAGEKFGKKYSEIKTYNPKTNSFQSLFKANPPESFSSYECCGSVQILPNGNILSANHKNGGYAVEIDTNGKIIWEIPNPFKNAKTGKPHNIQQVLRKDMSEFLNNNQPL